MSGFNVPESAVKTLKQDAAHARKEGALEVSTGPIWDEIVANAGDAKRSDVIKAVLTAAGEWKDTPQRFSGSSTRTPFGNVVQRFGKRYDDAVKRATPEEDKPVVLRATLSGEGGGSTVIEPGTALFEQVVALIRGE